MEHRKRDSTAKSTIIPETVGFQVTLTAFLLDLNLQYAAHSNKMNKRKQVHVDYRTYLNLHSRFRFLHLLQGISPQHLVFEAVQASQDFLSSPRVPRLQPSVGSAPTLSLRKIIS